MHREMTLKQRIGLCLAAFFMALAAQIVLLIFLYWHIVLS